MDVIRITVFWNVTLRSPVICIDLSEEICRFCHQGSSVLIGEAGRSS